MNVKNHWNIHLVSILRIVGLETGCFVAGLEVRLEACWVRKFLP